MMVMEMEEEEEEGMQEDEALVKEEGASSSCIMEDSGDGTVREGMISPLVLPMTDLV